MIICSCLHLEYFAMNIMILNKHWTICFGPLAIISQIATVANDKVIILATLPKKTTSIVTHTIDFPECDDSPCEQICVETDGSFQCSCTSGYILANDGRHCNGN